MLKAPRAPVRGFTPSVSRAIPGTPQEAAKQTASRGLWREPGTHTEQERPKEQLLYPSFCLLLKIQMGFLLFFDSTKPKFSHLNPCPKKSLSKIYCNYPRDLLTEMQQS